MKEDDHSAWPGVHYGCGGGEDVLGSRYILEIEPTGYSGDWLEGLEGQQQTKSRVAGLSSRMRRAVLVGCRETIWEEGFRAVGSHVGHVKSQGSFEQLRAHGRWAGSHSHLFNGTVL